MSREKTVTLFPKRAYTLVPFACFIIGAFVSMTSYSIDSVLERIGLVLVGNLSITIISVLVQRDITYLYDIITSLLRQIRKYENDADTKD